MANKAYDYWQGLPTWAKGVIAVGGIAIVYFTAKSVFKQIKQKAELEKERKTQIEYKNDLASLKKRGIIPSYTSSQYKSWADKIEKQFSGSDTTFIAHYVAGGWSGSGGTLKDIIVQFKNDADFASFVDAYGIRTYDQAGWFTGNFTGNIFQAVQDELSRNEIEVLNDYLTKQKITYKF